MDKDDRFLRLPEVMKKVGFRKDWIYKNMRTGDFPKCINIGAKYSVWLESDIIAWMEKKIIESPEVERKNALHKNQ